MLANRAAEKPHGLSNKGSREVKDSTRLETSGKDGTAHRTFSVKLACSAEGEIQLAGTISKRSTLVSDLSSPNILATS